MANLQNTARQGAPAMGIPESQSTVEVYIIDTTSFMSGFPASAFVEPLVPGWDEMRCKSYSYLIRHKNMDHKYHTVLFDLGVRKDWENYPPAFVGGIKAAGFSITVEKDVATILRENGQELDSVGAIIWSHWHFDHCGDPTTFPASTDLIVGPGFRDKVMPGYPADPMSHVLSTSWESRTLREIDFDAQGPSTLQIGSFAAHDFYGDGSFYLLNSPGHATGHMSALARTTSSPPSYMILGGDIAHHCGEFRPSAFTPLPEVIPASCQSNTLHNSENSGGGYPRLKACPGRSFLAIHPKQDPQQPFFDPVMSDVWHEDAVEAKYSIAKLVEADAHDNIFPVMAHDMTLNGIIDIYPKSANDWMAKGWKEKTQWSFLDSFSTAVEEDAVQEHRGKERIHL